MGKTNQMSKSISIIVLLTFGSKILGFFRDVLIAAKLGAGNQADMYFVVTTITLIFNGFIHHALATTFIPVISELSMPLNKEEQVRETNIIISTFTVVTMIILVFSIIFAPAIVRIFARGFDGKQFQGTVVLTRIGLPMILCSSIIGILSGFLQSNNRHFTASAIGWPLNITYIIYLFFFFETFGINGLVAVSVLGVIVQAVFLVVESRKLGYFFKFIVDFKNNNVKKIMKLSVPVIIGVAINDINIIVDKTLASSLVPGSISALNYANKLNGLILGVFISAVTTVIFPLLSKESSNNNISDLKKIMRYGFNIILLITIPATVGMIVLAKPIVEVAFQRGVFDATATVMTSQALIFYSVGLVAQALRLLFTRVYYSLQDTKTPMVNGAIAVGFNIVLNLILIQFMAHVGLALATSIANTIATIFMFYGLKKKIGSLGTKGYINTFIKSGLASGMMGVIAFVVYKSLYGFLGVSKLYNLISLLVAVGVGVVVYGVLCYVFRIEEIRDIVKKIGDRFGRL